LCHSVSLLLGDELQALQLPCELPIAWLLAAHTLASSVLDQYLALLEHSEKTMALMGAAAV